MWGALLGPLLGLLLLLSPRDSVHAAQPQAPGIFLDLPNSDKGTIKLKVPVGLQGQALLKVWGLGQHAEEGPLFHNQTSVTVDSRGASVFIQTDKPVYRPQHRVLISVFTVTPDLRPVSEEDPRGSRMMEWRHVEPVCCGVTNMTFPLSDQPVLGEWVIFVEMQGHVYNKSFEVQKYVLPKFELLIDPPHYIRDLDACETGTVQARYTFGKPVSGTLTINMTVNGVGYYSQEVGRPVLRTMKIHSSQDFDICVRDMIPADVPEHFRGTVSIWATVTAVDGSQQVAFDDSTPVQRQLVDIRYSKVTRKQFKPGLSYVGMVELSYPDGSPAEGVTVQIRAELTPKDNIYTTESVSRGGLVGFEIPSIPMSAQHVWLETKVTALNGKPAGTQYLPSYLSLSSWYSPSQCYLQLQPPSHPLQVGEEAHFSVKSTCPCNFTLYYEVAARGNIVLSGQQPAHITQQRSRRATPEKPIRLTHLSETEPPPAPAAEVNVCVTSLQLAVTPSMAPVGRLLVFYVRENGEGVADSLQFTVETFFENQVSLTYSANETQPGEAVDLRVRAARGSCVCVAVVDKSVYLLRSGFRLTPVQVFRELEDYDVSDAFGVSREDGPFWWAGLTARRRRRSSVFPWPWGVTRDSGFAFTVRRGGLGAHCPLPYSSHFETKSLGTTVWGVKAFKLLLLRSLIAILPSENS
ncbi:C3 and PZP-like alpha-2-macroglobulin domain-containing protein 8 [Pteropus alecto]|uniref:C3 and PZP-like alpha-2-macroglobulin domain-containing protein 8 n=1 Tax=Pteropus alecto TaxID=9402 RepID=L5L673_PTEAL|nr:C3 and PZP-like alpha-2-macroglobulin domain-containing protein 8 [Pteropus alecto]